MEERSSLYSVMPRCALITLVKISGLALRGLIAPHPLINPFSRILTFTSMEGRFVFAFILCCGWMQTYSQPTIPVDPLSGNPQISIPFWQVKSGNVTVPVSLFYSAGGVKVEDGEGTAGMSWFLEGGGSVTRQLKGLPDDYLGVNGDNRQGWLSAGLAQSIQNFTPTSDTNLSTCADESNDFSFLNSLGFTKDSEPDIFRFYAPGLSGSFVFGGDGLPKVIPYQDIKIDVIKNAAGSIDQIKITNNEGTVYLFNLQEIVTRSAYKPSNTLVTHFNKDFVYYSTPLTFTNAWQLSSISSAQGNTVYLSYSDSYEIQSPRDIKVVSESGSVNTLYTIKDVITTRQLTLINSPVSNVTLEWEGPRISKITINEDLNNKEKVFHFDYVYANDYRDTNIATMIRRAWLKEIRQITNCKSFPSYVFEYYGLSGPTGSSVYTTTLPFKDENLQDLWGFYNGSSTTKVPDIYIYNSLNDAEKYRLNVLPSLTPSSTLTGANRVVNASVINSGSLSSINYPSGAIAQIVYEPNSFFDPTTLSSVLGGGIRVKTVTIFGGEKGSDNLVFNYEYTGLDGQSSGKLLYRPVYAFADGTSIIRTLDNMAPEAGIMYGRTTVYQTGRGKTIYEYAIPAAYPSTTDTDWNATFSLIARQPETQEPGQPVPPCLSIGNQHLGYYSFPFAANPNFDFARGLVTRIADIAENGNLVQERIYSYQPLGTGQVNVKGVAFEKVNSNYVFGAYHLKTNIDKVTLTETTRRADDLTNINFIESSATYTYNSTHKLLEAVTTTNSDGVAFKSQYKYAKDFSTITNPDPTKPEAVALKKLNDLFSHASVVEVVNSKTAEGVTTYTDASLTLYKEFSTNKVFPWQQLSYPASSGFTFATVTTNGSSQHQLSYNAAYRSNATYLAYTTAGNIQSITDYQKNKSGIHYAIASIPAAKISNAFAEEFVYDGFERLTSTSFTVSSYNATGEAWTGNKGLTIGAPSILRKDDIQKGGNLYRYSLWIKAATAAQITFKTLVGTTVFNTVTKAYASGDINTWKYLEGTVDITTTPSLFSLEVTANTMVTLDDIRFLPEQATIMTSTIDPLSGETSVTDDRGISSFKEYDELGRIKYLKNRNKDVLKFYEYRYKKEQAPVVESTFTASKPESEFKVGIPLTFTATENCLQGVTFLWKIDGIIQTGTATTFAHTFLSPGHHTVELTAEHPTYGGASSTSLIQSCVQPEDLVFNIQITDLAGISPPDKIFSCDGNYAKQFSAVFQSGGCGNQGFTYQWAFQPLTESVWYSFGGGNQTETFSEAFNGYRVRCIIIQDNCYSDGNGCYYNNWTASFETTTTYVFEEFCE